MKSKAKTFASPRSCVGANNSQPECNFVNIVGKGGFCVSDKTVNGELKQDTCSDHPNMLWNVVLQADGTVLIQSKNGQIIDNAHQKSANGNKQWAYRKDGTPAQNYFIETVNDGNHVRFRNKQVNKCFDMSGTAKVGQYYHIWDCSTTNKNQWFEFKVPSSTPSLSTAANSAADAPRVWGTNSNHDIFTLQGGINGSWKHIAGKLVNLAMGQDGRVWGINKDKQIFTRAGVEGDWVQIPGGLNNLSVGQNGRVWGVNKNHEIYTRPGVDGEWKKIDGLLTNISAGQDGRVWGVNKNDDIFTRDGVNGAWVHIDGKLRNISVGQNGRVWGCTKDNDIFTRAGVNSPWVHIEGKLKWIQVGQDGTVWGVTKNDDIFTRAGVNGSWVHIAGKLHWVSAQVSMGNHVSSASGSASSKAAGPYYNIVGPTGLCVSDKNNNGNLIQETCNDSNNMMWTFLPTVGGHRILQSKNGRVMDNSGSKKDNKNPILGWSRHNGANQQWAVEGVNGNKSVHFRNIGANKCFDDTGKKAVGTNYHLWDCSDSNQNQWFVIKAYVAPAPAPEPATPTPTPNPNPGQNTMSLGNGQDDHMERNTNAKRKLRKGRKARR